MGKTTLQTSHAFALLIAGMLANSPALADKPSWAGGNRAEKHGQQEGPSNQQHREMDRSERADYPGMRDSHGHFDDRHRAIIRDYYAEQFRTGKCPPGLAKKHNGCLPPGQAKKWMMGKPLPRDLAYYDLPPSVMAQLGQPPAGYRYVRVASDILMISAGTNMVVDAIQDLGRR